MRHFFHCPLTIARKSTIDQQKVTTLEYEMKEYGEVHVMSWHVLACPEKEVRVVRCGEFSACFLRGVRPTTKYLGCSDPKRAERQEQVSKSAPLRN